MTVYEHLKVTSPKNNFKNRKRSPNGRGNEMNKETFINYAREFGNKLKAELCAIIIQL